MEATGGLTLKNCGIQATEGRADWYSLIKMLDNILNRA